MNKKTKLRYFIAATIITLAVVAVSVYSCEKRVFIPNTDEAIADNPDRFISEPGAICGNIVEKRIMKSADDDLGEALVYNDAKYFYVILTSKRGHYLKNAYMEVCDKFGQLPLDDKGAPEIAKFEYKIRRQPASTVRKFRVPIAEIKGNNYVAVAVEFVNQLNNDNQPIKLAWVDGKFFGTEDAGRVFTYTKQQCLTTPGETEQINE